MSVTSSLVPSDVFSSSGFRKQSSWSDESIQPTSTAAVFAQSSSPSLSSSSSSSPPGPTSSPPVPPAPAAAGPSSAARSSAVQSSTPQSSGGNYAASASAAVSTMSSPVFIAQPAILASIIVASVAVFVAIATAAFLLIRRSRRRRTNTAGMARITSRDDRQGDEKRPWKADAEQPRSPSESAMGLRPPSWAERSSVPSTLPSYSSRASRPSRPSTARSSATWEDNSEIDVLATDGSSTIRTFSTYSEPTPTATTPTLTNSGSPLTATVGSLSPNTTVNTFDDPGYTYPVGSSNASAPRHRPQLSIDTSGVVFEPRTRSRAEHLRDEYMRSQVALNPFDDSAAAAAAPQYTDLYRSPAWSHGNQPSRTINDVTSPWAETGAVIGADGSADLERRGRSRMVMPPTYSKLFPSSGPQPMH